MNLFNIVAGTLGSFATLVTIFTGYIYINEYFISKKIEVATLDKLPIKIKKSITFKQYKKGLKIILQLLKEQRFHPDVIVGIHYGGSSIASNLGKLSYIPVVIIDVKYHTVSKQPICDSVSFKVDPQKYLKDKNILILDNSITTGGTLKMAYDEVRKYSSHIKTLVIYKKNNNRASIFDPDYILFQSNKPLKYLIK